MPTDPFSSISQCNSSSRVSMARCSRVAVYSALSGSKKLASCSVGWAESSFNCANRRRFPTLNIRVLCWRLDRSTRAKVLVYQFKYRASLTRQLYSEERILFGNIAFTTSWDANHDLLHQRGHRTPLQSRAWNQYRSVLSFHQEKSWKR